MKLIASHPHIQGTLRSALLSSFPSSAADSSPPSAAQILDADIPYLDAALEETVRVSATAGIVARRATVATTVIGCPVPAGTELVLNTRFARTPISVPEDHRSASSRAVQAKRGAGSGGLDGESGRDLHCFEPRRWLGRGEGGEDVFDASALPSLVFRGGLRGCFGEFSRRLDFSPPAFTVFLSVDVFLSEIVVLMEMGNKIGKKLAMHELRIMVVMLILNFEFLPLPEELQSMAGVEKLFRRPKMCHVRLRTH